jgi:hypothetical protein
VIQIGYPRQVVKIPAQPMKDGFLPCSSHGVNPPPSHRPATPARTVPIQRNVLSFIMFDRDSEGKEKIRTSYDNQARLQEIAVRRRV